MQYRGLRIASSILFKIFWIGYLFLIVAWFAYTLFQAQWQAMFLAQWHTEHLDYLEFLTLGYFTLGKFVLLFFALVPAIAIRLTLRQLEKKPL